MKMKMSKRIISIVFVFGLLGLVGVAYAASPLFDKYCDRRRLSDDKKMICDLHARLSGVEATIPILQQTDVNLQNQIDELAAELEELRNPPPAPTVDCSNYVNDSQPVVLDDFNGYADGSIVGQGSWESYALGDNFVIQGAVVNEGAKALHNNSSGDSVVGKQGTARTDGKQAVCVRTENRANWGLYADGNAQVRISKGLWASGAPGLSFASVTLKSDGNVAYYDPVADVYSNFATYNDNEWTLLEFEWRSSDKTARYRVNSGTWTDWKGFANSVSFTGFDYVNFGFVLPSGSGGVYFDTLR